MPKVSDSFTKARKQEILSACEELYETKDFKDITVKDIAEKTNMSRASVYNYFQTKEEIFLGLLKREYDEWIASLDALRTKNDHLSVDEFADAMGQMLAERWQLLKILSMNHYDMESNSRPEMLACFKVSYGRSLAAVRECLEKFFPGMPAADVEDFLYAFFPFMFGIYPYTFVNERQKVAMKAAGVNYVFMTISEIVSRFVGTVLEGWNLIAPRKGEEGR